MDEGKIAFLIIVLVTLFLSKTFWNEITWPWMATGGVFCLLTGTPGGFIAAAFVFIGAIWSFIESLPKPEVKEPGEPMHREVHEINVGEVTVDGCTGTIKIPVTRVNPKEHFRDVIARMGWPALHQSSTSAALRVVSNSASWEGETVVCDWFMDGKFITYRVHSKSNLGIVDQVNSWNVKKMLGQFESF